MTKCGDSFTQTPRMAILEACDFCFLFPYKTALFFFKFLWNTIASQGKEKFHALICVGIYNMEMLQHMSTLLTMLMKMVIGIF